jgi:hypothetical protein
MDTDEKCDFQAVRPARRLVTGGKAVGNPLRHFFICVYLCPSVVKKIFYYMDTAKHAA